MQPDQEPASQDATADGYYGDEEATSEELDLSFLDQGDDSKDKQ